MGMQVMLALLWAQ